LGAETFGWELFVEEKLSLVLVQNLPTPETFESFVSLLGADRGMVYVQPPNNVNRDDANNVLFSDDSFERRSSCSNSKGSRGRQQGQQFQQQQQQGNMLLKQEGCLAMRKII